MLAIDKNTKSGIIIGLCILVIGSLNLNIEAANIDDLAFKIKNDFVIDSFQVKCAGTVSKEYDNFYSCSTKWAY